MNIITWKAYLRNLYYEYEFARNLATRSKNQNIHSRFLVSVCLEKKSELFLEDGRAAGKHHEIWKTVTNFIKSSFCKNSLFKNVYGRFCCEIKLE